MLRDRMAGRHTPVPRVDRQPEDNVVSPVTTYRRSEEELAKYRALKVPDEPGRSRLIDLGMKRR